jgi:hypothetical protein
LDIYSREELFTISKNEQYTEKGLQTILSEISNDKNIGVNYLRSAFVSFYFPNINLLKKKNSLLMRSSVGTL